MPKVAIVTDSTANIPGELLNDLAIYSIPLHVIWGPDSFRDGVDILPKEVYTRLEEGTKVMPTTSQPTPAAFSEVYRGLLDQGYDILSIHISSSLSGTVDSALKARQNFPGARIEVIDSRTTTMAMGFLALAAARAAAQGATIQECQKLVEDNIQHTGVLFVVKTLEFLRRGGRIGGASAFLGTAFDLKPILEIRRGRIEAIDRVRTMSKAIDKLMDLFSDRVGQHRPLHIAALHANNLGDATQILERAIKLFSPVEISETVLSEPSPVIGIHAGPGVVGLAFMAG